MLNIKSLITTLSILSATSTAALADNSFSVRAEGHVTIGGGINTTPAPQGPTIRDHRTPAPVTVKPTHYVPVKVQPQWQPSRTEWNHPRPHPVDIDPTLQMSYPTIRVGNFSEYTGWMNEVPSARGFVPLTQPTRIETIREGFFTSQAGDIKSVEFKAVSGKTYIKMLGLTFADGTTQFINVEQTIDAHTPLSSPISLQARGKLVKQINVYGTSPANTSFQVLASS